MPLKVALVFSNYGPYHIARIKSFYNHCQPYKWEVYGVELARSESEYPWQIELADLPFPIYSVVQDQPLEQVSFPKLLYSLLQLLRQIEPDVLAIAGYARPAMLAILAWSIQYRKLTILFSDTKEDDASRSQWREIVKSWIVNSYNAALVAGQVHKRYLAQLGMPEEAIFLGYDVVENDSFHPDVIRLRPKPLATPYFLSINRFVPKKNLLLLINAYAAYRQIKGTSAWNLVLCGDGQMRSQIEQQIAELNLQDFVYRPGFLQQGELLPYFAHASCFIHASVQEEWGLVVNEAMAAGLPVLVSNRCGCFEDLVLEGINGFGFDPENQEQLTTLMLKLSSDDVDLQKMGQSALEHIQAFSPAYFADSLMHAIAYATAHSQAIRSRQS